MKELGREFFIYDMLVKKLYKLRDKWFKAIKFDRLKYMTVCNQINCKYANKYANKNGCWLMSSGVRECLDCSDAWTRYRLIRGRSYNPDPDKHISLVYYACKEII